MLSEQLLVGKNLILFSDSLKVGITTIEMMIVMQYCKQATQHGEKRQTVVIVFVFAVACSDLPVKS